MKDLLLQMLQTSIDDIIKNTHLSKNRMWYCEGVLDTIYRLDLINKQEYLELEQDITDAYVKARAAKHHNQMV